MAVPRRDQRPAAPPAPADPRQRSSSLIADVVPVGVVARESFDDGCVPDLFPAEAAAVARAVSKRRREFAAVRRCAREALTELGIEAGPILPGPRGAPQWPKGVVGSMTHCDDYVAAVVAATTLLRGIGIDAEPHEALPAGVLDLVAVDRERSHLRDLGQTYRGIHWDRILFCAKESIYKAWYPVAACWLGFDEAIVSFNPEARIFTAELRPTAVPRRCVNAELLTGRWLVGRGLVVAAAALHHGG